MRTKVKLIESQCLWTLWYAITKPLHRTLAKVEDVIKDAGRSVSL